MAENPKSIPDWQATLSQDPVMGALIQTGKSIDQEAHEDIYLSLLGSIISQQLSTKVARVIRNRFLDLFTGGYPEPKAVLAQSDETLRSVGLSYQKLGYIRNAATFALAGHLDYTLIGQMEDEALIKHLTQVNGVGRWTAEMILMFTLSRPDVFPIDDLGIQNAMKKLYGLNLSGKVLQAEMIRIGESWRPYRTLASRYLWQSLDNK